MAGPTERRSEHDDPANGDAGLLKGCHECKRLTLGIDDVVRSSMDHVKRVIRLPSDWRAGNLPRSYRPSCRSARRRRPSIDRGRYENALRIAEPDTSPR